MNVNTDREFFRNDELIVRQTKGVVNNVIELMPARHRVCTEKKTGSGPGMIPLPNW